MKVLQITVHFSPNVGGVETHLDDLISALVKQDFRVFVLAYQPLSTRVSWKMVEKKEKLTILRMPWIRGFFEKLVNQPALEFIYLLPGLLIVTPIVILFFRPEVLHGHGLVSGFVAAFWGRIFRIKSVVSLHSIYRLPSQGFYHSFVKLVFSLSDKLLCLSRQSVNEISTLGIPTKKIKQFTYWIDLKKFIKVKDAKRIINKEKDFIVLYVGRLVPEKGLAILIKSAKIWNKKIKLLIVGSGSLENLVKKATSDSRNIQYQGVVSQEDLPLFYSAADVAILPSTSEEGFGRVIIESMACGTPVIGANRGAIPEAIDVTVGKLITIDKQSIKNTVEFFYNNPTALKKLSKNTRRFAERRYSEKNVSEIIKNYID